MFIKFIILIYWIITWRNLLDFAIVVNDDVTWILRIKIFIGTVVEEQVRSPYHWGVDSYVLKGYFQFFISNYFYQSLITRRLLYSKGFQVNCGSSQVRVNQMLVVKIWFFSSKSINCWRLKMFMTVKECTEGQFTLNIWRVEPIKTHLKLVFPNSYMERLNSNHWAISFHFHHSDT